MCFLSGLRLPSCLHFLISSFTPCLWRCESGKHPFQGRTLIVAFPLLLPSPCVMDYTLAVIAARTLSETREILEFFVSISKQRLTSVI